MQSLRNIIRGKRRAAPFSIIGKACEKYLRAWNNEDFYDFARNGEGFALEQFRKWHPQPGYCVWDVGAHEGEWARDAHATLGDVTVVSFELIGPIAEKLATRSNDAWHRIVAMGLSDSEGEVDACWNQDLGNTSSLKPREESDIFQDRHCETVRARLSTVDACIADGLPAPLVLKIDVEGADASVLRGASALLNGPDAPAMIQFEYGQTWIPFSETLRATWRMLHSAGYSVGRLFADHVQFKDYDFYDEHYRMGNYIAVRDATLKAMLANVRQ